MRILLVTYWGLTNMGGIWTYMSQLADKLSEQGHDVTLMGGNADNHTLYLLNRRASFDKKFFYNALLPHLDGSRFPHLHEEHGIFSFEIGRYVFEGGAAYLGLENYDVIHAQDPISSYALRRIMKVSVPLVSSVHGALARESYYEYRGLEPGLTEEEYIDRPIWSYFRRMESLGANAADRILVSSQWIGQLVHALGVSRSRIHTQPYGINLKQYDDMAKIPISVVPETEQKVIMYAGRLEYIKGVHVLLDALGILQNYRQDWVCVLAGIGSLEEELKMQARELGVQDRVIFAGKLDNIPAALTAADIYVQPSLQDTQPYSVTEAQLAGIAPIVSETSGMPEMVRHGVTGWVVPPEDADKLAKRLEILLREDKLRERTGKQAREWAVRSRSLDIMAEGTLQVYREVIAAHQDHQVEEGAAWVAEEDDKSAIPEAFHPSDVLAATEAGSLLAMILHSKLPSSYSIPDARILSHL